MTRTCLSYSHVLVIAPHQTSHIPSCPRIGTAVMNAEGRSHADEEGNERGFIENGFL
ncbi:hypothetical protein TRIATDRAFT_302047 [Trichoderma atroviride IMI 206040]|uniref:Uncharacterized protein n=1 Tax=Hypocrea atroviridis (strain ATCC 20476 / IMI 206040) TaxID=452589 RepID=G9P735_HYPAI|nr:uncharacterized protein TRIATDRAFT_302047 [Trichoderma atroviride IMI 206040]EHK41537.1 hypothetical protein TRIATDRAFT_302047 [Trichoderma atroviride IMI 206040]